ncbi:hypothetical protein OSTOST_24523, partial [Ostertagia ostertagi]
MAYRATPCPSAPNHLSPAENFLGRKLRSDFYQMMPQTTDRIYRTTRCHWGPIKSKQWITTTTLWKSTVESTCESTETTRPHAHGRPTEGRVRPYTCSKSYNYVVLLDSRIKGGDSNVRQLSATTPSRVRPAQRPQLDPLNLGQYSSISRRTTLPLLNFKGNTAWRLEEYLGEQPLYKRYNLSTEPATLMEQTPPDAE